MEIIGPEGEEAWEYLLVRYQGRDGTQFHDGISLSGQFFSLNPINGYGFIYYKFLAQQGGNLRNGKRNGDALALVYNGQCIQFICYGEHDNETFVASTGPCINQTCMNIGVHEDRKQPVGLSLQLVGRGRYMENFTWHNETLPWTPGRVNQGQELMSEADYLQVRYHDVCSYEPSKLQ